MSECLITRHGGKYRVGKLIFGNNLSVIQNYFAEIWSNNNYSNGRQIVTDNNDVYVLCIEPNSAIHKLSGVDGSEIWSKNGGDYIAIDKDNIYMSISYYTYDAQGNISGYVIRIIKLSGVDGSHIWTKDTGGSFIAADSSGDVYASLVNRGICKLSGVDGSQIWYYGNGEWGQRLATDSNNDVYLSSSERSYSSPIRKLSGVDGTVIWTNSDVGYNGSITTDDENNVYVLSDSVKKVRKLSGVDGSEIWNSRFGFASGNSNIAIDNNKKCLYISNNAGYLLKLSSEDGTEMNAKFIGDIYDVATDNTGVYILGNTTIKKLSTNSIYKIIS